MESHFMLTRVLEPEVMDTVDEAVDYDAMDHSTVNRVFVDDLLQVMQAADHGNENRRILDTGTGTAQIPIEFCNRSSGWNVRAIDLAGEMLRLAEVNVRAAGLSTRISLEQVDSKKLPYESGSFDAVMSNSIVHHIPEPASVFSEMSRVVKPGGLLFVRDLLRPDDQKTLEDLVQTYAGDENAHQQKMFRESLGAALTVAEVRELITECGISPDDVRQTTDRHWTLAAWLPVK
jgi:ubiquinone/menaquinone biosynthesis C-methylase UbiE